MTIRARTIVVIIALVFTLFISSCACEHDWKEATCEDPKTCLICGETQGDPLGHTWLDATCEKSKICSVCGQVEGEPLGHQWLEATCTDPKTCSLCGKTEGKSLGHSVGTWTTLIESTCSEKGSQKGTCDRCGKEITEELSMLEHTSGEWEIETEAGFDSPGFNIRKCLVCGKVIAKESFHLSDEEKASLYRKSCSSISYDNLARNPDEYIGELVVFTGEIIQAMDAPSAEYLNTYRINVTKERYFWTDTLYVSYDASRSSSRLLEDDIVKLYGKFKGLQTYETIFGASVTIPWVEAKYIDLR